MRSCMIAFVVLGSLGCCGTPGPGPDDSSWVKCSGNPVLLAGRHQPGTTNDYYNLSDCFVIKDGGVYKMWYTSSGSTAQSGTNHDNISYATSNDGIVWVKYAGNPVLDIGAGASDWDRYGVETVSVLIDPDAHAGERYKMWYAGQAARASYDIGYAYSPDGVNWTKYAANPVLCRGGSEDWDNAFIEGPSVVLDGGVFKMWYAGFDAVANAQTTDGKVCIGYATSGDGFVWVKHAGNPVLLTGGTGTWDSRTVQDPHVIRLVDGYHMWFGGKTTDVENYGQQTGYAFSADGISWTESVRNPVLRRGASGSWDAVTASFPTVLVDGSTVRMWYTGMDRDYYIHSALDQSIPNYWEIGYAERPMAGGSPTE